MLYCTKADANPWRKRHWLNQVAGLTVSGKIIYIMHSRSKTYLLCPLWSIDVSGIVSPRFEESITSWSFEPKNCPSPAAGRSSIPPRFLSLDESAVAALKVVSNLRSTHLGCLPACLRSFNSQAQYDRCAHTWWVLQSQLTGVLWMHVVLLYSKAKNHGESIDSARRRI